MRETQFKFYDQRMGSFIRVRLILAHKSLLQAPVARRNLLYNVSTVVYRVRRHLANPASVDHFLRYCALSRVATTGLFPCAMSEKYVRQQKIVGEVLTDPVLRFTVNVLIHPAAT